MTYMPSRGLRRRSTRLERLRRRLPNGVKLRAVMIGGFALVAVAALIVLARLVPAPGDPVAARAELAVSGTLLAQGNATGARSHALTAVAADAASAPALVALGRAYLALGQGSAAEAALNRAVAAGARPAGLHALYADAALLLGDPARALIQAAQAPPRDIVAAMRTKALALAATGDRAAAQRLLAGAVAGPGARVAAVWTALGRVRAQSGDVGGAIAAADRALAIDRGNVDALILKGELVRDQYGLIAALPWFETALRIDPWRHAALIQYAATLGDAGQYRAMLDATRRALMAEPGSGEALYLQAVLAARAGDDDLARALLDRSGAVPRGLPGALLLGGMFDFDDGAWQQAIAKWRALLGQQPMNLAARRLLGAALYRSGDPRAALEVLRPIALRGDADSYTLALVGRAFELTGERDWAARFLDRAAIPATTDAAPFGTDEPLLRFQAAADRAPGDPVAAVNYIRALIDAGRAGEALGRAQTLVRGYPGAPVAQLLTGDILARQNRLAAASDAYRRAANLRFDEPTMLRVVATLDRIGKRAEAATALALFLSQHPGNVAAARLTAHWQIADGAWDDAIDTLEDLRDRTGNRDAALLTELATAYAGSGDLETAQVYAANGYALAPLNPVTSDGYGWVLHLAGDNDAAIELIEKAVAIAPGHGGLRWHLAQAYAARGRNAAARAAIASAMTDPGFADRAAAAALLRTIG